MAELIVLLGMGESGKTTYAESLKTHIRLDFDSFQPYGSKFAFNKALLNISSTVNSNTTTDFVLDGYIYLLNGEILDKNLSLLREMVLYHWIKPRVILSDIDIIVKRVLKRGSPDRVDKNFVISLYKDIFTHFQIEDIIVK